MAHPIISETYRTKTNYYKIKGFKSYHTVRMDFPGKNRSALIIKESEMHYVKGENDTPEIQATKGTTQ